MALGLHTRATELSIEYSTVVYGLAQFIFEFLFDSLEELNVVSAGEQPAQELRLVKVDSLKCVSERSGLQESP